MIKQIILPLAGVAAFIVLVGLLVNNSGSINIPGFAAPTTSSLAQKSIKVNEKPITVDIANTEASRAQGLGGRSYLPADSGMLFVFDSKAEIRTFWMKGMLIPLDIIWIQGNSIVQIDKNVPAPNENTPDSNLKQYSSVKPVDYVLEVNAGFSDKNEVKVGDSVDLGF